MEDDEKKTVIKVNKFVTVEKIKFFSGVKSTSFFLYISL